MAEFRDFIRHSGNYLIANLATRALAFISIPVYTRLLSTEDYGIISVYLAVVGIFNSILALSFDTSISRYYFDKTSDDDFKQFVGTTFSASSIVILCMSTLIIIEAPFISEIVKLPLNVVYFIVPMVIINIVGLAFFQIYQPQKLSRTIALSSLIRVYLGFLCSIILIFIFQSEKYLGQILGQILAGCILLFYWITKIKPFVRKGFNKQHFKYIVNYSVPLIPYALSGVIIEQFGKLAIASNNSFSQVSFYTLALSIASLTGIVTEITHQAWFPYYMEYMKTKNYEQHDRDLLRIFRISLLAALFFSYFGHEIGLVLAKKEFTSALYLVPLLTIGYVCHQFSYAYMRNISFSLKTSYMSIIVITSGILNVFLNTIFIVKLGMLGAALSFVISYFVMAVFSWFISTYVVRVRGISAIKILKLFAILLLSLMPLYFILQIDNFFIMFIVKILFFIGMVYILIGQDRFLIYSFIKQFIQR